MPFVDEESFDEIRFAAYRTAAKLLFIQNKTNCEYMVYDIIMILLPGDFYSS